MGKRIPLAQDPTTWDYYNVDTIRKTVDGCLKRMTELEAQVTESEDEIKEIKSKQTNCLNAIKLLDEFFWRRLCPTKEEEEIK